MDIDAKSMRAQLNPCKSCPFAGSQPINLSPQRLEQLYKDTVTLNASHLCHTANNKLLCRGARDLQIKIAYLQGFISECSDDAFQYELEKH